MATLQKFHWVIFVIFFGLALWVVRPDIATNHKFEGDELRYMSYAVSLHKHGVFGLMGDDIDEVPLPGNANAPLYPVLLAGIMALDPKFSNSLVCLKQQQGASSSCTQDFQVFFAVQVALAVSCLFFIYRLAYQFKRHIGLAWLSVVLAFASGILQEFSFVFMTEILVLPLFTVLLLFCLLLYQKGKIRWVVAIGLSLAALTMIRPSYLYLFYGFVLFFVGFWGLKRDWRTGAKTFTLIAVFFVAVLPWSLRNKTYFDSFLLTAGGYGEAILIQRVNYNQMILPEVGVAMVYWLPDFGDSLAQKLFPEEWTEKLGWGEGSYYKMGFVNQKASLSEKLGDEDKILGHLIREEVLTLKHIAVSVPLAMRGVFIAKYWGLAGFVAFIVLGFQTLRRRDCSVLVIAAPLFFMVAFHAGLSVSIPRYNLPLLALYALSLAWYINLCGRKIAVKFYKK